MNKLMMVKKVKGSNQLSQIIKPIPEVITYYTLEYQQVIDYFEAAKPGLGTLLDTYWESLGAFNDAWAETVQLPLPEEDSPEAELRDFILEEYPEWEQIQFLIG